MTVDYKNAKGWLTLAERETLFSLARDVVPIIKPFFVNIGVEYGASLACLRAGRPEADIRGLDIDLSKVVDDYGCRLFRIDSRIYLAAINKQWQGIDIVFVDGDHGYDGVWADIGYANHIHVNGYIIFHDCYDWPPAPPKTIHSKCPGINRAVSQWYSDINGIDKDWQELEPVDSMRIFKRIA